MSPFTTQKSRALRTAALSAGGLLLVSLGFAGASAAPSDGVFAVKAVDQDNVEVFAQRGDPSLELAPVVEVPGAENPADAVLYTMKCGPASIPITDSMRALANKNVADYYPGNLDGMAPHADGWSMLIADSKVGEPIPESKPGTLTFFGTNPTRNMGSIVEVATGCTYNMADKTKPGMNFYSYVTSNGNYTEGRTNGEIFTQVSRSNGGATTIFSRSVAPSTAQSGYIAIKSVTVPFSVSLSSGQIRVTIAPPATTDGYNLIESVSRADGSGLVQFKLSPSEITQQDNNFPLAKRQNGPSYVDYNAAGLITKFTYANAAGEQITETPSSPLTVAQYNARTGQSWDGNLYKPSSFDLTVPFEPTAPTA